MQSNYKVVALWVVILIISLTGAAYAQTCAAPGKDGPVSLTGNVNTYYQPANTGSVNAATGAVALTNPLGSGASLEPGDLALVVQMQCENLNSTNTSAYGANTATGRGYTDPPAGCSAGRYEYVRAGPATTGTSLDLTTSPLVNTYIFDPVTSTNRRTYQVIRVPQYASASLAGIVTAVPWNGVSGGIVAMDVTGNLNMNGQTIDVSASGFRGGGGAVWNGTVSTIADYVIPTNITNNQDSMKGEGIVGTPRLVFNPSTAAVVDLGTTWGGYTGGDQGRGAPGNAGGGGNNFNNNRDNGGGGGGGNGNDGGFGGYGWNNNAFAVGYVGELDLRGIGGSSFTQRSISRLVLGGGGGAGANNNSLGVQSSGGAGGGVVLLRSGSMSGIGTINANGAAGQTQPNNDSGGGGGAAGSVAVFSANGTMGALTVNANGGIGGDGFLLGNTAHAGGGGGAGGVVFTSSGATINANGGVNGKTNINGSQDGANNGATVGGTGVGTTSIFGNPLGVSTGAACLPQLTVKKVTSTPLVTLPGGTTAQFSINVSNAITAGAAYGVSLRDVLPIPFGLQTITTTATTTFSGTNTSGLSPTAANQSGNTTTAVFGVGGTGNTPTVSSFTVFPGGSVTVSFIVNVNSATPGTTFQNSASVTFTDPTRTTGGAATSSASSNPVVSPGVSYASGTVVGGSNYSSGSSTAEDVTVAATTTLSVAKTNAVTTLTAGSTTSYTLTFSNNGGYAANNAVIKDTQSAGLSCTSVTCASTSGGASCPTGLVLATPTPVASVPNLFNAIGIAIPTFPAVSAVVLTVTCGVTATGQ